MSIELREINMDNFRECIELSVKKEQNKFVASNMYSLAEAKADNVSNPYAIYSGNVMVGFIMYDFNTDTNVGWITRLMVDQRYQGKGYGRAAMVQVVDRLKSISECKLLQTSFEPSNSAAKTLYLSLGFHLTGEQVDGEDICIMEVNRQ